MLSSVLSLPQTLSSFQAHKKQYEQLKKRYAQKTLSQDTVTFSSQARQEQSGALQTQKR